MLWNHKIHLSPQKRNIVCHILGILGDLSKVTRTITVSMPQGGHGHCSNAVSYNKSFESLQLLI